jgi:Tol biopolymer transport system component
VSISPRRRELLLISGGLRTAWANKRMALADPATGSLTTLTDAKLAIVSVAWSPDGSRIAYASGPGFIQVGGGEAAEKTLAQRRIWIMNADGTQARQLTFDPRYRDEYPLWSQDGRYILFTRMTQQGEVSIWSINVNEGAQQEIVSGLSAPGPINPGTWFGYYGFIDWRWLIALHQD